MRIFICVTSILLMLACTSPASHSRSLECALPVGYVGYEINAMTIRLPAPAETIECAVLTKENAPNLFGIRSENHRGQDYRLICRDQYECLMLINRHLEGLQTLNTDPKTSLTMMRLHLNAYQQQLSDIAHYPRIRTIANQLRRALEKDNKQLSEDPDIDRRLLGEAYRLYAAQWVHSLK